MVGYATQITLPSKEKLTELLTNLTTIYYDIRDDKRRRTNAQHGFGKSGGSVLRRHICG